jgi:hypothetical protein
MSPATGHATVRGCFGKGTSSTAFDRIVAAGFTVVDRGAFREALDNVLGSSGSVVPLVREQIARGGPVTVTDPRVTRYFMTIPEAAQLILQAAALGRGGEIFLLEMGQPVRILDLAHQMIRLSGFEPDEDITIEFTGLRPGEKLHEELVAEDEEVITASGHERMKILRSLPAPEPDTWLPALEGHVRDGDLPAILGLLQQLVPGYRPSAFLAAAHGTLHATNGNGRPRPTSSGESPSGIQASEAR